MKKNTLTLKSICLLTFISISYSQTLWEEDGIALRQGDHIGWEECAAVNNSGETCVIWTDCRDGMQKIYIQKYSLDNIPQWEEGGIFIDYARKNEWNTEPEICASEDGGFIITWEADGSYPEGAIKAQKLDSNGNFLWDTLGTFICNLDNINATFPMIVSDGFGGALITWRDNRNSYYSIYASHILCDGTLFPGWQENGTSITLTPATQGYYYTKDICSDGAGGIIVTWHEGWTYNTDIYAQRMSSEGERFWGDNGIAVCTANNEQEKASIASNGEGGAFIVWEDNRDGGTNIYMSNFDFAGNALWSIDGIPICTFNNDQKNPQIISDGEDGAYVVWEDCRDNQGVEDIYAQRIDFNGNIYWENGGVPVCSAEDVQTNFSIESFGNSGFAAVWEDMRNEEFPFRDIYSQFISNTGQQMWDLNGIPIAEVEYGQINPLVLNLPDNEFLCFWEDHRKGSSDIYTQKANEQGNIQFQVNGDVVVEGLFGKSYYPFLLNLPDDKFLAVWADHRHINHNAPPVFFQIFDIDGNCLLAEDGVPVVEIGSGKTPGRPEAILTSDEFAIIVWRDYDYYSDSQVIAQKIDMEGNLLWGPAGIRISPTDYDQEDPFICSDDEGGAFIAFSGWNEELDFVTYVQRIGSDGSLIWGEEALDVFSDGSAEYTTVGIVPDGSGNAIVVSKVGDEDDIDIKAARVLASGDTAWTMLICDSTQYSWDIKTIPSQYGGAIVAWIDDRNGSDYDIYAQKINNLGIALWSENGLPVITMDGDQKT